MGGATSGTPKISFSAAGVISVNGSGKNLMDLGDGNTVSIGQDETTPENWYLYKDENGFKLRLKTDQKTICTSHKELCAMIRESFGIGDDEKCVFGIAEEPTKIEGDATEYWGLLSM